MAKRDKAGSLYWDSNSEKSSYPLPFDAQNKDLDNYVNLKLHEYFLRYLSSIEDLNILEIGSANLIWPLYFHEFYDTTVSVLDYSEVGCQKSKAFFKKHNIPGSIYCADLFNHP